MKMNFRNQKHQKSSHMRDVLLVNDDGYKSAGIRTLFKQLQNEYAVVAVAPENQQSWKGKSISGHTPINVSRVSHLGYKGYSVTGSPADCTQVGMFEFFESGKPDLVVSGLNDGANIGQAHILSSGTVGAALEASLQGIPAFASSVWGLKGAYKNLDFESKQAEKIFLVAAKITTQIINKVMESGFPKHTQVICINVPFNATVDADIVITKPHSQPYGKLFKEYTDGNFVNVGNTELCLSDETSTDLYALTQGKVSVIPLKIELTSDIVRTDLAKILNATLAE